MILLMVALLPVFVLGDCPGPSSYVGELNTCLHVDNQVAPFKFADKYCAAFGGRLISINSAFKNAVIGGLEITRIFGPQLFIGATSEPDGVWKWTDGTPFYYHKWAPGEPRTGGCAYLSSTDTLWRSIDCSTELPFFCEIPQTVPIDCTTPGPAITCPSTSIFVADLQTCVYADNDAVTFGNAEKYCTAIGGHLFSFHGLEAEGFVTGMAITDIHSPTFYIGYNNMNGTWRWTDQSPNDYSKWADGPGSGNCAAVNVTSSFWNGVDCGKSLPFMCSIPPVLNGGCTTTSVPFAASTTDITESTAEPLLPTGIPPQCGNPDYQPFHTCAIGWTYLPSSQSYYYVGFKKRWQDAEEDCVSMGSHLASIHSEGEEDFIKSLCCKVSYNIELANIERTFLTGTSVFWIGAKKTNDDNFTWTDGSPVDFSKSPSPEHGDYFYLCNEDGTCSPDRNGWGTADSNFTTPYYVCKSSSPWANVNHAHRALMNQNVEYENVNFNK